MITIRDRMVGALYAWAFASVVVFWLSGDLAAPVVAAIVVAFYSVVFAVIDWFEAGWPT